MPAPLRVPAPRPESIPALDGAAVLSFHRSQQ
jgi:hypothetical protein